MTVEEVARIAVQEWLEDGIEFCYIYEQEAAETMSDDDVDDAFELANEYLRDLIEVFTKHG